MAAGVAEAEQAFERVVWEHKIYTRSQEVSDTIKRALKVRAPRLSGPKSLRP